MARHIYNIAMLLILISCGKQKEHSQHQRIDTTSVDQAMRTIALPADRVVLSSQKTIKPNQRTEEAAMTANGYIAFDERRNRKLAVRIAGRIERLYIRYNYQFVKKGEAIAEIYSPELRTYQEEYLFLKKSGEDSLLLKSKEKLKLLGLGENQIQQLEKKGDITETITINSPIEGFIRFSSESISSGKMKGAPSSMDGMSTYPPDKSTLSSASEGQIREGGYVSTGQTLFIVNDIRQVWAILSADIPSQIGFKKGMAVKLYSDALPEPVIAKVDFVEPTYENGQRFTQVRIYLDNTGRKFKINSLISGTVSIQDHAISVPASSVYDLGTRKIVWVKTGTTSNGIGLFEASVVAAGMTSNGWVSIIKGLKGDEEIAVDAGYMLDSESILNEKQ